LLEVWAPLAEVLPEPAPCVACRIRAASPLIERAALLAAAASAKAAAEAHAAKFPTEDWDRGYVAGLLRLAGDLTEDAGRVVGS
jgi:hypothetical protein